MRRMLLLGAYVLTIATCSGCYKALTGSCDDTVKLESRSPAGEYIASVVERNCGATTGYSSLVILRRATQTLVVDDDDTLIFALAGMQNVSLVWLDETKLTIEYPIADTYTMKRNWKAVVINYRRRG